MYHKPGVFTARVMNGAMRVLIERLGVSPRGGQVLVVRGRKSGKLQSVPVNPLDLAGKRYLVAPRGTTQWARNLRVAGEGELRLGKRTDRFAATEVRDADKVPILRAYMQKWALETGFEFGISKDAPDAEFARIAPDHPVFQIESR